MTSRDAVGNGVPYLDEVESPADTSGDNPRHGQSIMTSDVFVIVAAYNEADRIGATLAALAEAFPGASLWVADDGSLDGTGAVAEAAGATVVRSERRAPRHRGVVGKGGAMTLAASEALKSEGSVALLCDGDLGESAARLGPLV